MLKTSVAVFNVYFPLNKLLNRRKEKAEIITPNYSSDLRHHFQMLLRTKDEFYKIFDISKTENETISASKIQNWWRKISTGNSDLTKRKNAVSKIEAWWIGTNTKRKINNALKSGKYIESGGSGRTRKWTVLRKLTTLR